MAVHALKRLFTVEEFHRMAEGGVFSEDDRVELLAGEVIEMTPIGGRHAACVDFLAHHLHPTSRDWIVRVQSPIVLGEQSEPEPDISLLRYRSDFYRNGHPTPADVLLVIEVADTSLLFDRVTKLPLYARAGVPEVWIVDLINGVVEVHRNPQSDAYRDTSRRAKGDCLEAPALPGFSIPVADLL